MENIFKLKLVNPYFCLFSTFFIFFPNYVENYLKYLKLVLNSTDQLENLLKN